MTKQEEIERGMFKIVEQGQRLVGTPEGYPGIIAHRLLKYLAFQDVVIRADGELPKDGLYLPGDFRHPNWLTGEELRAIIDSATEPLIKE